MRKVLIFALTLILALGGLVFAHAAVTDSQDNLHIYPALEIGDHSVLEGLTAEMTFTCGDHLRWHTAHTFGGEMVTEFAYSPTPTPVPTYDTRNGLTMGLSGGMSASTSGDFPVMNTDYGAMLREVAMDAPTGGSATKKLRLADYVDYYRPDYVLLYEDAERLCSERFEMTSWIIGDTNHIDAGAYNALVSAFRFPVQEGHILSITAEKDDTGNLNGIELYPENGPDLRLISDVNAGGIWFVPVFQDAEGTPLPYESPAGHGIYFIPWRHADTVRYTSGVMEVLTPDVAQARLLFPLDETRTIIHMEIDADAGEAWMLTCEGEHYVLTAFDLAEGQISASLEVLPRFSDTDSNGYFFTDEGYLLVVIGDQIALVDTASHTLLLTAPDAADQTYGAHSYNRDIGDVRFDGETLILTDTTWPREPATFWAAAYRQGELVYYGEYNCSLMRGNDDWYYSSVRAEEYPIELK